MQVKRGRASRARHQGLPGLSCARGAALRRRSQPRARLIIVTSRLEWAGIYRPTRLPIHYPNSRDLPVNSGKPSWGPGANTPPFAGIFVWNRRRTFCLPCRRSWVRIPSAALERPAFAGLFVRAVGWCVCVAGHPLGTRRRKRGGRVSEQAPLQALLTTRTADLCIRGRKGRRFDSRDVASGPLRGNEWMSEAAIIRQASRRMSASPKHVSRRSRRTVSGTSTARGWKPRTFLRCDRPDHNRGGSPEPG